MQRRRNKTDTRKSETSNHERGHKKEPEPEPGTASQLTGGIPDSSCGEEDG